MATLNQLPLELIEKIALEDSNTYKVLIYAISNFGRYSCEDVCQTRAQKHFTVRTIIRSGFHKCQLFGRLHCVDGPALFISSFLKAWYRFDIRHRVERDENGKLLPSSIREDVLTSWYQNDKLHNDDTDENGDLLPAVIHADGFKEYWINGVQQVK